MKEALHRLDATSLAQRLAQRELNAVDVVRACLDRIAEREAEVQAWAFIDPDHALAQARELDRGPMRGLLHGLPVGVKDLFDTADMPTTYGSPIYASNRPLADAAVVALCREQGAVMLGKTVTTEFATFTPGKTRNPYRLTHTPGGSSSGSAAAVADYMVPLAFASQTAASVIRPAAFCGIVGYKPSFGLINRAGVKPLSDSLDTIGFLARSIDDVALLAAAANGERVMPDLSPAGTPRIALCHTHEWPHADDDTRAAFVRAEQALTDSGVRAPALQLSPLFSGLLQAQKEIMAFDLVRSLAHERLQHAAQLSAGLTQLLQEQGLQIAVASHRANLQLAATARAQIDTVFEELDALLVPSAIGEAPTREQTGDPVFGRVWTLLGLPCIHLPFTTGHSGLPVGLQLVGRHGQDRALLRIAKGLLPLLRSGDELG
jgi:Asp-tRNA(Asn)/Glu-tRNA(Gln) amidotransferase A subunit family amidase